MKEIPLTQRKVALVDDVDYEWLIKWKWYAIKKTKRKTWYAARMQGGSRKNRKVIYMHKEIIGRVPGLEVDHRDGDGLNNQRENLRHCTLAQNQQNKGRYSNNTSGYKGVYKIKERDSWTASIRVNRSPVYLGIFKDPVEAAKAYDEAAVQNFGEFARLNFPKKQSRVGY